MADQEQLPGDEDEQAPLPVVAEGDDDCGGRRRTDSRLQG